ncbi:MAG: hypothetical protein BMS9Abin23_0935 [Thermodesulfobacteriota bacterium]|nr:MAG: hypothetical protein BMS9Abin23_0935 [Thermodesulfobacteriota bacterium]
MLLLATPAFAQGDSVTTALGIVEDFHSETIELVNGVEDSASVESFVKKCIKERDRTLGELGSLRWIESPGERRFERVSRIVDSYMTGRIDSLKGLKKKLNGRDRKYMEKVITSLVLLKKKQLEELGGSLKAETYRKKELKPVPIIDRSPFEKGRPGEEGIWYR